MLNDCMGAANDHKLNHSLSCAPTTARELGSPRLSGWSRGAAVHRRIGQ